MNIGVLALQGDFAEHKVILQRVGVQASEVRLPGDLVDLDGLIIPGGESTTIGKLANDFELLEPLRKFGESKAMWGTCAGAIFLSKDAYHQQPLLGLMDIFVEPVEDILHRLGTGFTFIFWQEFLYHRMIGIPPGTIQEFG